MMDKKGMGIGQVFIFIVVALTFGLITIFGYKAVNDFLEKGEQVEFVRFKTDLESSIKRISTDYGSSRQEDYRLPGRYLQVCFVDMDYNPSDQEMTDLCSMDEFACQVWEDAKDGCTKDGEKVVGYECVDDNVFLQPAAPVPIKVNRIKMASGEGFFCEEIGGGRFSLRLEGRGSYTQLSNIG